MHKQKSMGVDEDRSIAGRLDGIAQRLVGDRSTSHQFCTSSGVGDNMEDSSAGDVSPAKETLPERSASLRKLPGSRVSGRAQGRAAL